MRTTHRLIPRLTATAVTAVLILVGTGTAARAASVHATIEQIEVVLSPREKEIVLLDRQIGPWSVCVEQILPQLEGVITVPLDTDRCMWGVLTCAEQSVRYGWSSFTIVFTRPGGECRHP